jgi:putative NIF3 family GTP cyclohydrolase 1 type 2
MQDCNLVCLEDITGFLDDYFEISLYAGKDKSFTGRIHQYFASETISKFETRFVDNCNGLMFRGNNHIKNIYGTAFLSDDVLLELCTVSCNNTLLIVHHPIDIEGGINDKSCKIGYKAVSNNLLYSFLERGNSIYVIHLPLDLNKYNINTHSSFFHSLNIDGTIIDNLIKTGEYNLGYVFETSPIDFNFLVSIVRHTVNECFLVNVENNTPKSVSRIGLIAGMLSAIEQIKQIEDSGCEVCICGDLFIRDESNRYFEMKRAITKCLLPFICVSHNISESLVFTYGLFPYLKEKFPSIIFNEIQCDKFR